MNDKFSEKVKLVVGPTLSASGFTLDAVDDAVDEDGRCGAVVFYRAQDCKLQIYQSSREGEVNCMVASLDAPNTFGPRDRSNLWQYLLRFAPAPDLPLEELVKDVSYEFKTDREMLDWVREQLSMHLDSARQGIQKHRGQTSV